MIKKQKKSERSFCKDVLAFFKTSGKIVKEIFNNIYWIIAIFETLKAFFN